MNAQEIARFLHENPDFFIEHAELFADITVPHPQHGQAISLAERQLHALREKIVALEDRLVRLIRFGEENDDISGKVHQLSVRLLAAADYLGIRENLFQTLLEDFAVPHVALRVWNTSEEHGTPDFDPVSQELRNYAAELSQPWCGEPANMEIVDWFGEAAPHIRSVALVPLHRRDVCFGLLAMASEEAERFYSGMGTVYLTRIGELAAIALVRELG